MTTHAKQYRKQRQDRARREGMCLVCWTYPAAAGKTRCATCAENKADRDRERRQYRIDNALCVDCARPGMSTANRCRECLAKAYQGLKARRQRRRMAA